MTPADALGGVRLWLDERRFFDWGLPGSNPTHIALPLARAETVANVVLASRSATAAIKASGYNLSACLGAVSNLMAAVDALGG